MLSHRTTARGILFLLIAWVLPVTASAGAAPERILFPVVGNVSYVDDFGDARGNGRHEGNDLMAERKAPAVAAEAGTVELWTTSARAGCMLYLHGRSGTTYRYIHLNNDLTGGNDNGGSCVAGVAYAPGLRDGQKVRAGELIGFVGDSGDANSAGPHLHFELRPGGGGAVSPYPWLQEARRLLFAAPAESEAKLAAAKPLTLALYGTVRTAEEGTLAVRVTRVRMSNGWSFAVTKNIVLAVPAGATVERATGKGREQAAPAGQEGERVVVWTTPVGPTLPEQLGAAGALSAARVLYRGSE